LCTAEFVYTPPAGFTGSDSFTFVTVDDAEAASEPATVTIDVQAGNTAPVAVATGEVVQENGSVVVHLEGVDADGDALTFATQSVSTQGGDVSAVSNVVCVVEGTSCTAEVTYIAPVDYVGPDSFTFTVDDGQDMSGPATVTIDVQAVANVPPAAQPGSFPVVSDGSSAGRILYATDADEDLLTFSITRQPDNGSVSGPGAVSCAPNAAFGGAWTCQQTWGYLANPGYSGADSFEFEACDPSDECSTATVDVNVTAPAVMADLSMLTLSDAPDPVTAGGVVAYQATVKNLGPATATGVTVEFADAGTGSLPTGVTFVSGTVSSSVGGTGSCTLPEEGSPVTCTLGGGTVSASGTTTWTVTVYLQSSASTPATFDLRARVQGDQSDPVADNELTESTVVEPFGEDETTVYVPPSTQTETVATAETVLVGGEEIPIAQTGDTTAAAASVPPGGPGGVVTVAEFTCEPPFVCADPATTRTTVPPPEAPPIDSRVIQFIPPNAPYYNYLHPVTYSIVYDVSVVAGVNTRSVTALYTKDTEPETIYQAAKCPKKLTDATEFPCLKSAKILKGKNRLIKGDLRLTLLGTYNDPKIAGFR
jgi:uncharacterized repeat protein (TIGR01451 family)